MSKLPEHTFGPRRAFMLFTFLSLWQLTVPARAQFRSFDAPHLRVVYYSPAQAYLVPHVARCFENALQFHERLFDYHPSQKFTVFLQDLADYGNGGAEAIPQSYIFALMSPFSHNYEVVFGNERMNWMMNHELAHIATMDRPAARDNFFRSIFFGKVYPEATQPISMVYSYFTNPRRYAPRWYMEGSAVFLETWMAGGLGRALSSYYEMVFRAMVRDNSKFFDVVGLESEGTAIDFQVGANSYLYGTRFMSYVADRYGPERLMQWLVRSDSSKSYYTAQFKKTFGLSLDAAWAEWITWEKGFQQANLDSLRRSPITPYRPLTHAALGSVSRSYYDPAKHALYAAVNYPGHIPHLAAIDIQSGAIEKICEVRGAATYFVTSLAYAAAQHTLFYATKNSSWRDVRAVDVNTGATRTLLENARVGDLVFSATDSALWGIRHDLGLVTLVRIPPPYHAWHQIKTFPYGEEIYDLEVSPDGAQLVAAYTEPSGRQKLIQMETQKLLAGDSSFSVLYDFEFSSPESFAFSPDGKHLYGSSYYSGVSNIYRYDFASGEMNVRSNAETGFFRPVPFSEDSLIAMSYTAKGFLPVMIPNRQPEYVNTIKFLGNEVVEHHPLVKSWKIPPPTSVVLDTSQAATRPYSTLTHTRLSCIYPQVEGYKDYTALGLHARFDNPLRFTELGLTASYTPQGHLAAEERLHLGLDFRYWQFKFKARYNGADFYDLFGPTKRSRKGYAAAASYKVYFGFDESSTGAYGSDLQFELAGFTGLEKLPQFQNVDASFERALYLNARYHAHALKRPLGALEAEKGTSAQLNSENTISNGKFFPHIYGTFDYGLSLPLPHSALWLRSAAGYAHGERDDPFANFYFGGFGNNWVDHLAYQRYREYYSFPGVDLNAVGGTNFFKITSEWMLPPVRFRRVGMPAFYCRWARLALFSTGLATNLDSAPVRREVVDLGGQLDFNLVLFSNLTSTFSLGYAAGFEQDQRTTREFMISLKIL